MSQNRPGPGGPGRPPAAAGRTAPLKPPSAATALLKPGVGFQLASTPAALLEALREDIRDAERLLENLAPRVQLIEDAFTIAQDVRTAYGIGLRVGVEEGEYLIRMARAIREDADLGKRVQVALHQFRTALDTVDRYATAVARAGALDGDRLVAFLSGFAVEKLRGALFPLVTLRGLFRGTPVIADLLPSMPAVAPRLPGDGSRPFGQQAIRLGGTRPMGAGGTAPTLPSDPRADAFRPSGGAS